MLRFAPSPTADMHIGDLRIAILNYLVSQQKNDQFLVRIEDSNTSRNIEGKDTEIMMILEKFALKHDAVYHQTEHLNLHQTLAIRLLKEKKAFICKCPTNECSGGCENLTQEEYATLKKSAKPFVIRIKNPNKNMDTFTILKTDGIPSLNFAVACDDMLSDVTFIIQEEKYRIEIEKHNYIKKVLGYEKETQYKHLPSLLNADNISVKSLFEDGFIPDAILNYLLLLDNKKAPKEVFTLPQSIEWFDIENISKSAVKFDIEKLRFINREHLKMMDEKQLSTLFGFADADIGKLAKLYLKECSTINELQEKVLPIFKAKDFSGELGESMKIIENIIFDAPAFKTLDALNQHITNESGLKGENLLNPLRQLLTNTGDGPELSEIYPLIKSYLLEVAS